MDYGIKVSKSGNNVDGTVGKNNTEPLAEKSHILYSLALPYLFGAQKQLERYRQSVALLPSSTFRAVNECLHEASTLFEDLNTIGKYAELCGDENDRTELWLDIRNHIRHDVREEFDNESKKAKNVRAKKLGIDVHLQTNIGFSSDAIKVGSTVVTLQEIQDYISWASTAISKVIKEAQEKGYIKSTPPELAN